MKIDTDSPSFNEMQVVKRHFFALRNGVIADTLRKAGSPFKIIFGLNLPQLVEVAEQTPKNADLALRLWENNSTRESMLLAPMIYPRDEFDISTAIRWIESIPTMEVADILCHRLLRHQDYALSLALKSFADGEKNSMKRYVGLRLMMNLVSKDAKLAKQIAQQALDDGDYESLAKMLLEEAEFILEGQEAL